jgi:hypothetical protein
MAAVPIDGDERVVATDLSTVARQHAPCPPSLGVRGEVLVVDELQEYWNRQAIADWVSRLVVASRPSLDVRSAICNGEHTVVRVAVDGDFDKAAYRSR